MHRSDCGEIGDSAAPAASAARAQTVEAVGAVQFRIVADAGALAGALADICGGAALDEIAIVKQPAIDLRAHLQRVAPVGEHGGFIGQHHGRAG